MKPLYSRIFIFLFSCILFTSCIEIEENYTIKKNGSGSYEFKVDMTQMMEMMKAMGGPEGMGEEVKDPSKDVSFDEELKELEKVEGISNIQSVKDQKNGIVSFSFDFESLSALNNARKNTVDQATANSLTLEGNKLTLNHLAPEKLTGNEGLPTDSASAQMAQGILTQIKYNINFSIEGGAKSILTDANSDFETSDKETFQLQGTLKDLTDTPDFLNAIIELN